MSLSKDKTKKTHPKISSTGKRQIENSAQRSFSFSILSSFFRRDLRPGLFPISLSMSSIRGLKGKENIGRPRQEDIKEMGKRRARVGARFFIWLGIEDTTVLIFYVVVFYLFLTKESAPTRPGVSFFTVSSNVGTKHKGIIWSTDCRRQNT